MFIDFYSVLKIDKMASSFEVRKAYLSMVKIWHPDINNGQDTTEQMKIINQAWLILGDDVKRKRYDVEYELFQKINSSNGKSRYYHDSNSSGPQAANQNTSFSYDFEQKYQYQDDVLYDWVLQAKEKAKLMILDNLEDAKGMIKAGKSEFVKEFISSFLAMLFLAIIISIIMLFL